MPGVAGTTTLGRMLDQAFANVRTINRRSALTKSCKVTSYCKHRKPFYIVHFLPCTPKDYSPDTQKKVLPSITPLAPRLRRVPFRRGPSSRTTAS